MMPVFMGIMLVLSAWMWIDYIIAGDRFHSIMSGIGVILLSFIIILIPFIDEIHKNNLNQCTEKDGIYLKIDNQFKCVQDIVFIELE